MTTMPNTPTTAGLNPLFSNHVDSKEAHARALSQRVDKEQAARLFVKDLALHAALTYYAAVMKSGQSFPPRGDTIIKTAQTFEAYYEDMVGGQQ